MNAFSYPVIYDAIFVRGLFNKYAKSGTQLNAYKCQFDIRPNEELADVTTVTVNDINEYLAIARQRMDLSVISSQTLGSCVDVMNAFETNVGHYIHPAYISDIAESLYEQLCKDDDQIFLEVSIDKDTNRTDRLTLLINEDIYVCIDDQNVLDKNITESSIEISVSSFRGNRIDDTLWRNAAYHIKMIQVISRMRGNDKRHVLDVVHAQFDHMSDIYIGRRKKLIKEHNSTIASKIFKAKSILETLETIYLYAHENGMCVTLPEDDTGSIVIKDVNTNGANLTATISAKTNKLDVAINCTRVDNSQLEGLYALIKRMNAVGIAGTDIGSYLSMMKVIA